MGKHSIAEAEGQLSELIDRALTGEEVVITRDGTPVAEIRPVSPVAQPLTAADVDWLKRHRVGSKMPSEDAATLIRRMCDEEDH